MNQEQLQQGVKKLYSWVYGGGELTDHRSYPPTLRKGLDLAEALDEIYVYNPDRTRITQSFGWYLLSNPSGIPREEFERCGGERFGELSREPLIEAFRAVRMRPVSVEEWL